MRIGRLLLPIVVIALLAPPPVAPAQRKKKEKEPKTQILEILPDPPAVTAADASRLVFTTAPMSPEGLLSKQVRDGLRALFKLNRRARIVHLRAFVAGSGDTRRVQAVVSEVFSERKLALPSLSVVQVGALPSMTADVVLESVAESRQAVNPHGLAFISGQAVNSGEAVLEVAPQAKQSLERIRVAASSLVADPAADVLRVTCYCSSIEDGPAVRRAMAEAFPAAARTYVQLRRVYTPAAVNCEAVARLAETPAQPFVPDNPQGLEPVPGRSQVALVGPGKLLFTGTQLCFRYQDADVHLAFERLGEHLEDAGAGLDSVAVARFYTLSFSISDSIRKLRHEYFEPKRPPASTLVELEGLPSLDASFAMDAVAVAGP